MACPTCDHTMHYIRADVHWCPRCGTIKTDLEDDAPKLVGRVRELTEIFADGYEEWTAISEKLGIHEAIHSTGKRRR